MALSDKLNLIVKRYVRRQLPLLKTEDIGRFLQEELRELEASIQSLTDASVQVTDREPVGLRKGMVRYAVSPWNPLNNSFSGLVVYNGTAWVAV
tara:strand:+ start:2416 stop:2697 length:282 start_codon:yes stop_codon:yes gene_type:complete